MKLKNSYIIGLLLLLGASLAQASESRSKLDEAITLDQQQAEKDAQIVANIMRTIQGDENIVSDIVSKFSGQQGKERLQNIMNFKRQVESKHDFSSMAVLIPTFIQEAIKGIVTLDQQQAEEDAQIVANIMRTIQGDENIVSDIVSKFSGQQGKERLQNIMNFKRQVESKHDFSSMAVLIPTFIQEAIKQMS